MPDRRIRAFLVVGGVSVACAWTWPGVFPEADPVAVLVRYHTPNVYRAVVAWYYVAPGVAVFLAGQLLISTSRIWFARMGVRVGRRSRLPTLAAFAFGRRAGHRRRRGPSPGQSHREPGPRMADDPGAGPLYGRGDFRRGRVRQDVGVYAPVRAPALRLAGDESRAARGGAGPGSEGRFLPRHPPDADRAGPRRRLHRAESRWSADVESPECHLARFVLARVHGRVPLESTLRQGQRTLLATGLHESGPLDHRALPRAARRMCDASRRVSLCHRQGAVRQQDPTGADLRGVPVGCVDQRVGEGLDRTSGRPQRLWVPLAPGG